jgi:hypothetical protein
LFHEGAETDAGVVGFGLKFPILCRGRHTLKSFCVAVDITAGPRILEARLLGDASVTCSTVSGG